MLVNTLSRYWWMLLLRGVAWVLFGLAVMFQPGISLVTLTLMFGVFALIDGVGHIVSAIGGRQDSRSWWTLLLSGLAGVLVGVLAFISPGITALVLLYYIAAWAIVTGLLALVAAIRLRQEIENELWLGLAGIASVAFGLLLVARPGAGVLTVLWLIAVYAIAFGVTLVLLAFRTRAFGNRVTAAVRR
jgi:uncharacterized membrane protein HdeD (DUF308 family)